MPKSARFRDIFALLTIAAVIAAFFFRLFYPEPKIIVSQEFGRSDVWSSGIPNKYTVWTEIRNHRLPLWEKNIGQGFPIFSEGGTGLFFLPTIPVFSVLDFIPAYNSMIAISFLLLGWGMYTFLRTLRLTVAASLIGSLTLVFSGQPILQIPHLNLLLAFSLLPWILLFTVKIMEKPTKRSAIMLSLLFSQQILTGFLQAAFLTLILVGMYCIHRLILLGLRKTKTNILVLCLAILLVAPLSAVQILPWLELRSQTAQQSGFDLQGATRYSYPFKHIASFIRPYVFGSPKDGTYPDLIKFNGSIFWENTAFVGYLPLLLVPLGLLRYRKRRGALVQFGFLVLSLSLLLMGGKHSPLYFIFSLFPFNLFRVPSRFLWLFLFSVTLIASVTLDELIKGIRKKYILLLLYCLMILNTVHTVVTFWNHHQIVYAERWLKTPEMVSIIDADAVIYPYDSENLHNAYYLKNGWTDESAFFTLRNTLAPVSNVLWDITSFNAYVGRFVRRQAHTQSLAATALTDDINDRYLDDKTVQKLLQVFFVDTIIGSASASADTYAHLGSVKGDGDLTISAYRLRNPLPHTYVARKPHNVTTLEEAYQTIVSDDFVPGVSVLTERSWGIEEGEGHADVFQTYKESMRSEYTVKDNSSEGILVMNHTYFPGWEAHVDGVKTEIFPVNIQFIGIPINPGSHTITLTYRPHAFFYGLTITIVSYAMLIMALIFCGHFPRRLKKIQQL